MAARRKPKTVLEDAPAGAPSARWPGGHYAPHAATPGGGGRRPGGSAAGGRNRGVVAAASPGPPADQRLNTAGDSAAGRSRRPAEAAGRGGGGRGTGGGGAGPDRGADLAGGQRPGRPAPQPDRPGRGPVP